MDAVSSITTRPLEVLQSLLARSRSLSGLLTGMLSATLAVYWIHLLLTTWGMTGFTLASFSAAAWSPGSPVAGRLQTSFRWQRFRCCCL